MHKKNSKFTAANSYVCNAVDVAVTKTELLNNVSKVKVKFSFIILHHTDEQSK